MSYSKLSFGIELVIDKLALAMLRLINISLQHRDSWPNLVEPPIL